MKRAFLIAGFMLVAGCDGSVSLSNASIAEVATATAGIARPEPGAWTTDATLVAFDPGRGDSAMGQALREQIGETTRTEACLSPDDARRPLFGDLTPTDGADCTFRRFVLQKGHLDAVMTCRNAQGQRLEVRQAGSYSATAVDLRATVTRYEADGRAAGGMTTHVAAQRTGDCTEEEDS